MSPPSCSHEHAVAEPAAPAEPPQKRFRAVYKFHEGSSSAVRKTIKMSSLM